MRSSLIPFGALVVDTAQDLVDSLARDDAGIDLEGEAAGTWRIRIWRPTTPRRCGPALRSASAAFSANVVGASGATVAPSVE